jgi:RHS repeat-associated protein
MLASRTNTLLSQTRYFVYDVQGNLLQVTLENGDVISYEIDGLNRRIGKKINGNVVRRYLWDKSQLVAEINSYGTLIRRYVYATKSNVPDYYVEGGVNYKIVTDSLGSPVMVIEASTGNVIQKIEYDEFGRVLQDTRSGELAIGFAGGLSDWDTGLVRFGARDYDPYTGRWTSKDPILFDGGDTNLYGYVMNDPVNFIDPSGLQSSNEREAWNRLPGVVWFWVHDWPKELANERRRNDENNRFTWSPNRTPRWPILPPPFTTPQLNPDGGMCE